MGVVRRNLATIVAAVVVAIMVGVALLLAQSHTTEVSGSTIAIHDGEGKTHMLPLDKNDTLTVTTSLGSNTIVIEDGAAYISEADCPKGSCTHQQPISHAGEQLICLPHQLWVEVIETEGTASEAELDESAVTWDDEDNDGVDLVSR